MPDVTKINLEAMETCRLLADFYSRRVPEFDISIQASNLSRLIKR